MSGRPVVVKAAKVMPFSPKEFKGEYSSKMLLDETNCGSKQFQINHCVLSPGCSTGGGIHRAPYDEIYYVLKGEAILHLGGVDYDVEADSLAFIPGGTFHALTNKSGTEPFVMLTMWAGIPEPGVNEVYDMRKDAWGKSYREIGDES